MFKDRNDAAARLASELAHFRGSKPLVLAVPRGAVPIGHLVADALEGELDVVLVRKLGAPRNPELALAAIDESGELQWSPGASATTVDPMWLEHERLNQIELMRSRRKRYRGTRPGIDPAGRIVIVVDDGLATGSTMVAALRAIRARGPSKLVCAVPVASPASLKRVRPLCDELVCLLAPANFSAVSDFYAEFPQVDDAEVERLLGATEEDERTG